MSTTLGWLNLLKLELLNKGDDQRGRDIMAISIWICLELDQVCSMSRSCLASKFTKLSSTVVSINVVDIEIFLKHFFNNTFFCPTCDFHVCHCCWSLFSNEILSHLPNCTSSCCRLAAGQKNNNNKFYYFLFFVFGEIESWNLKFDLITLFLV